MKIPKGTSQLRMKNGIIEFISESGSVIYSIQADNINFSQMTSFNAILCSCGSEMLTISNWITSPEEAMSEVYLEIWEQPGGFPTPFIERIKNAFNALRGKIPRGCSEVMLTKNHLLALRAIVDSSIKKMDEAEETLKLMNHKASENS